MTSAAYLPQHLGLYISAIDHPTVLYILHIYIYREREELMEKMKKVVTGFDEVEEERNADWIWILDLACRNESHT